MQAHDAAAAVEHHEPTGPYWDPAVFSQDPAFWAFIGLLIFIGVVLYMKVPKQITGSLDTRAEKIAADIKNAEELRLLAEKKLEEAKRRQAEAEAEAKEIIAAAHREAEQLAKDAAKNLAETIARRQKLAEERIVRAEADAMRDVKLAAVDAASKAAETILAEQLSGKAGADQFAASLETVKKALA
jgi:F-type H+-transporting ATPase subunit b